MHIVKQIKMKNKPDLSLRTFLIIPSLPIGTQSVRAKGEAIHY